MATLGVRVREQATAVSIPVVADSDLPYVVGAAPAHMAEKPGKINKPVIATSWDEAVEKLGLPNTCFCLLEDEDGYSQDDGRDADGGYGRGVSYARGRIGWRGGRNTRRDSMGRYNRDDGRSEMMEHIEAALDAANDKDRETIKRFMRQLENA